jgi:hypothetical protein
MIVRFIAKLRKHFDCEENPLENHAIDRKNDSDISPKSLILTGSGYMI